MRACCKRLFLCLFYLSVTMSGSAFAAQPKAPLVLAAASLQESLEEAAAIWASKGHPRPVLSFAASSALARQIGSGAPADLFLSADEQWMDHVARQGLVARGTRVSFLGNRLALVAPVASPLRLAIGPRFALRRALGSGRLAMADPDAVPAGIYGKAALVKLGVWSDVSAQVARAENVRAALALVERGEAPLGIVYATDAKASKKVRVIGLFPLSNHPPIRYSLARLTRSANPEAEAFRRFLISASGRAIFRRYGFTAG